jgi:hypothetical protein
MRLTIYISLAIFLACLLVWWWFVREIVHQGYVLIICDARLTVMMIFLLPFSLAIGIYKASG